MPAKKPRVFNYTGSLISHPFKYITKLDLNMAPADARGAKYLKYSNNFNNLIQLTSCIIFFTFHHPFLLKATFSTLIFLQ